LQIVIGGADGFDVLFHLAQHLAVEHDQFAGL
jgi:hypothetical protein